MLRKNRLFERNIRCIVANYVGNIRFHIVKCVAIDVDFFQTICDFLNQSQFKQRLIRHDQSTFFTCKIPQSYSKTTRLKINLARNAEPEHILAPFCYGFDIQQVMGCHVDRNGIIAPTTTTEVDSHHHPIDILGDASSDRQDAETLEHQILAVGRLSKLHGTNEAEFAPWS